MSLVHSTCSFLCVLCSAILSDRFQLMCIHRKIRKHEGYVITLIIVFVCMLYVCEIRMDNVTKEKEFMLCDL